MKPSMFEYDRPESLAEALAILADSGDEARVLAGGQSLIPMMNLRLAQPGRLVDIGGLDELRKIERVGDELRIGALVTHNTILDSALVADHCPMLVEAYHQVAHHSIRNRGTLGGSLCHNDPAAEMPLATSVLGATYVARSANGSRELSADAFFAGDFTSGLEPDEILVEVRIPRSPDRHGHAFFEIAQRKGDFALVACAALLVIEGGVCRNVRLGYRNLGLETIRFGAGEAALEGVEPSTERLSAVAALVAKEADPPSDIHATADYRRHLGRILTERALARCVERASAA